MSLEDDSRVEIPEPVILEKKLNVAGVTITATASLQAITDEIIVASQPGNESNAVNVGRAVSSVRKEFPTLEDHSWLSAIVGDRLVAQNRYDLASAAYEYAFITEDFLWDKKAGYAQNFILSLNNHLSAQNIPEDRLLVLEWLKGKRTNLAEAVNWVYQFETRVSGHKLDHNFLDQAYRLGAALLSQV